MALVFVGFMGAGKSSALDDVLDTDALLEDQLEMSIASFFAAYGERRFRQREEPVVLRVLRSGAPAIALGGGSLQSETVRAAGSAFDRRGRRGFAEDAEVHSLSAVSAV